MGIEVRGAKCEVRSARCEGQSAGRGGGGEKGIEECERNDGRE